MASILALGLVLVVVMPLVVIRFLVATHEFGVTDRRVIARMGWVSTRTVDLNVTKVESLVIEQGALGRAVPLRRPEGGRHRRDRRGLPRREGPDRLPQGGEPGGGPRGHEAGRGVAARPAGAGRALWSALRPCANFPRPLPTERTRVRSTHRPTPGHRPEPDRAGSHHAREHPGEPARGPPGAARGRRAGRRGARLRRPGRGAGGGRGGAEEPLGGAAGRGHRQGRARAACWGARR